MFHRDFEVTLLLSYNTIKRVNNMSMRELLVNCLFVGPGLYYGQDACITTLNQFIRHKQSFGQQLKTPFPFP